MAIKTNRRSLLSSPCLVSAPFIKVTIGDYTFGVYQRTKATEKHDGFFSAMNVQYPNYIQSLNIIKINGQVNQYTLEIKYPVRPQDDPNFFEKVFSSVSKTRKIVFTYGDSSMPTYVYKDEEALITAVTGSFDITGGVINYSVKAVSGAALAKSGTYTFINSKPIKPSDEIKRIFKDKRYGLQDIFTGMGLSNLNALIDGSDKVVTVQSKVNISVLDYINYLAGCMVPAGSSIGQTSKDIYIFTVHDDTIYDPTYNDSLSLGGPYFKITRTSYLTDRTDAFEIDIGYNTNTLVTSFSTSESGYSLYYDYQKELTTDNYVKRLNNDGVWESVYAPSISSKNSRYKTDAEDIVWWTKLVKYPIKATITVKGLLRPAMLMQYVRLNVIFPGGIYGEGGKSKDQYGTRMHISSGLYLITKQTDNISGSGIFTTLELQKIAGVNEDTDTGEN